MNYLKLNTSIVWVLTVMQVGLTVYSIYLRRLSPTDSFEFAMAAFLLAVLIEVIFISDIYLSRMQNKSFWIISVLIFSGIGGIVYLIRRDKLHEQSRSVQWSR